MMQALNTELDSCPVWLAIFRKWREEGLEAVRSELKELVDWMDEGLGSSSGA